MTFRQWLLSELPNPSADPYNWKYLVALVFVVGFVVTSTLLLKNKSQKTKWIVLLVLASLIAFLEVTRRGINFYKTTDWTLKNIAHILLPRPGCAISCWLVMLAVFINKKWAYSFASMISLLCGTAFFASPGAGFNHQFVQFEELYSMLTHTLFYTCALCFVTYRMAEFKFSQVKQQAICFGVLICYVAFEMLCKIESDPFYFMPGGDVQEIVGLPYGAFLPLFFVFNTVFFLAFYLIDDRKTVKQFCNKLAKKN